MAKNETAKTTEFKLSTVTPTFRVSYPSVFKPKLNNLSNKMEFSIEAIFPKVIPPHEKAAMDALKQIAKNACIKKWGTDEKKWPKKLRSPFRDQEDKRKDDGTIEEHLTPGAVWMRLKSDRRPGIVDQNREEVLDESMFYAGCYARASVSAFAYSNAGNSGVSFSLNHLQFVKDGEPFSSRPKVEDAFEAIAQDDASEEASEDAAALF